MAIIYSYPRATNVESSDLLLICDSSSSNKATQTTTIQSIIDLGPQGTVTDVILNMPDGFDVVPNRVGGVITLDVSGFPTYLPADDPPNSIQYNENGQQKGSIQFTANPITGATLEDGVSVSVGHITRTTTGVQPKRGVIRIGSGPTNQSGQDDFGGTVLLEYVYPANGPVTPLNAAAYSFVGLRAPKYDINTSIAHQDYDLIFPQLNPEHATNNQPYEDVNGNNISQLLVVNPVDVSSNSQRFYETKFVSVDNLGVTAAGQNSNVQYNDGGNFAGDSSFNFIKINNGTEGEDPNSFPKAHEILLGAGGGRYPGMLTLFGDDDPKSTQGTSGILKYNLSTGIDYVTLTGPDIQTELSIATKGTGYVPTPNTEPTGTPVTTDTGEGSGLRIFIVTVSATGEIEEFSIAQQGGGYESGDIVTLPNLGDGNASFTVINAREGGNEILQYDIKLPKYKPFDDKIWFGKGTGKYGELTTNDYFKIKLVDFDPGEGHNPGGRLQLEIGSSNSTVQEPWGSILLNGGDNIHESGVLRLASVYNNTVGVMGPKAVSPQDIPVGETYDYDFMLPAKPPRLAQRGFINGVATATLTSAGSELDFQPGTLPRVSTTVIDPTTGTKIEGAGEGCIVSVIIQNPNPGAPIPEGTVASFTIVDVGDGYKEGDVLKINTSGTDELKKARITVTAVEGNKGKLLVVNESATTTTAFPHETRWVDFPLPRLNHGFSPYPIYQGNDVIRVEDGDSKAFACATICDIAAGQLTVARVFGVVPAGSTINVAVYSGEISGTTTTKLVAYGSSTANQQSQVDKAIYRINLDNTNVWTPVAGTPIVVVIEVDNINGDAEVLLLGTTGELTNNPANEEVINQFQTQLAFEMDQVGTSVFDSSNTTENSNITELIGYNTQAKSATNTRICHHFDPFAPSQTPQTISGNAGE